MNDVRQSLVWNIGLSAWIIQDGNYPDFAAGQTAEFAVEFYRNSAHPIAQTNDAISATHQRDAFYEVVSEKMLQTGDLTILDIGILVYREHDHSDESNLRGKRFRTSVHLGIDPFFYFETLAKIPGVPPLIYSWRIQSILRQTAPYIEVIPDSGIHSGRKVSVRDESRNDWEKVERTNAWTDDGGMGDYLLRCELLQVGPKRSRTATL